MGHCMASFLKPRTHLKAGGQVLPQAPQGVGEGDERVDGVQRCVHILVLRPVILVVVLALLVMPLHGQLRARDVEWILRTR